VTLLLDAEQGMGGQFFGILEQVELGRQALRYPGEHLGANWRTLVHLDVFRRPPRLNGVFVSLQGLSDRLANIGLRRHEERMSFDGLDEVVRAGPSKDVASSREPMPGSTKWAITSTTS
jgi:hypothetical protein